MTDALHVEPINDRVMHTTSEDCPCGPTVELVTRDDGSDAWIFIHHRLDGRP